MGWAAIDFETANADRASACALGLVVVQESQIVKRRSWLIRPSKVCFDLNNVMLHGITADDVAEMPTFAELWDEVHSEIRGCPWSLTMRASTLASSGTHWTTTNSSTQN